MTEPVWLLKPAILAVHNLLVARFGGPEGVRDESLLDSALARTANLHPYEDCTEPPPSPLQMPLELSGTTLV